jgi:hypothetical protein
MTPLQLTARLDALRAALRTLAVGAVGVWVLGALACVLVVGVLARLAIGAPERVASWMIALGICAFVAVWRWRVSKPTAITRVDAALWAEAQAPDLRYALVTLAEQERASDADAVQARLAAFTSITRWQPAVATALKQRRVAVIGRLVAAAAAVALAGAPWRFEALRASPTRAPVVPAPDSAVFPVGRVTARATIVAPAYTGQPERALAFGETIAALAGSVIRVEADDATGTATLLVQEASETGAGAPRAVTTLAHSGGWRGVVRVGGAPLAVRLRDPRGDRWIFVTSVADSAPVATLVLPAADTVLLDTTAVLQVRGSVHDDVGLRDSRLEYIISSGGGEQFTFKSGVLQPRRGALGRDLTVQATLDLGALGLKPGDLMHVRIAAHDGNTLTGPSLGSSETRTIRIPRVDERDSVAVEQLPPTPVDKSVLSQRQLLLLTERLVARLPRIDRPTMLRESQRIGTDQAKLRKQVADIVFARLGDSPSGEHAHFAGDGHDHSAADLATVATPEAVLKAADQATGGVSGMLDSHGDETPVVAVNRPLLEAYNAMWDATRALQGGVPRDAIDPMKRALAAIQRARAAERIYLRGTPPAAIVDLEKIRLIGTDSAKFEARRALAALPAPERRLAERTLHGLGLLSAGRAAALDSLRLVRLDALGAAPALAGALGAVIEAAEGGRDITAALLRARRQALLPWRSGTATALWLGGQP